MQEHGYLNQLQNLAEKYGILDIYAFGSRQYEIAAMVQGKSNENVLSNSDTDIAIRTAHDKNFKVIDRVNLTAELEDLFAVGSVDLVVLNEADVFLALEIIKGQLLYVSDPDDQARFELYIMRKAGDLLQFQKERMHAVLEEGAR